MRKAIGFVAAVVVAVASLTTVRAAPAAAADLCAGNGGALPWQPLHYPGFGPPRNTSMSVSIVTGACANGGTLAFTSIISGPLGGAHCGLLDGWGTANGRGYIFQGVGSLLVFQGGLVGVATMTEDATAGSCASASGQRRFLLAGAWILP